MNPAARPLLLTALALISCGGATSPDDPSPPLPTCKPGSVDIEFVTAPPDREFPGCVEVPAHSEQGSTARAWCCWKGTVEL